MRRLVVALAVIGAVVGSGCGDTAGEGRATADQIERAIRDVCGTTENERSGPRTITPIDLDGESGPSGFLVTCVNGRVDYVEATE